LRASANDPPPQSLLAVRQAVRQVLESQPARGTASR
jgi:hypothetical protein